MKQKYFTKEIPFGKTVSVTVYERRKFWFDKVIKTFNQCNKGINRANAYKLCNKLNNE